MTPEKRARRQAEFRRLDAWLLAHPWWSRGIALWFALAVLVLAESLKWALNHLAH